MNIKTLDLNQYRKGDLTFVELLKESLTNPGFFFLKNHGIPEVLLRKMTVQSHQFFMLSEAEKKRYQYPQLHHQVGYTPLYTEKGEYADKADVKEFFQTGDMYPFPYVHRFPAFAPTSEKLFNSFNNTFMTLLEAVALSLELPKEYFDDKAGNSIMRSIYYPPHENVVSSDKAVASVKGGNSAGMCASMHTDINMLTLLHALEPGLQLMQGRRWKPVIIPDSNVIVVNCGDMLEHVTGGRYTSGMHRVVCQRNTPRQSIPFFGHVKEYVSLVPLKYLGTSDLKKYYHKTAGEYLNFRLEQIGLKK